MPGESWRLHFTSDLASRQQKRWSGTDLITPVVALHAFRTVRSAVVRSVAFAISESLAVVSLGCGEGTFDASNLWYSDSVLST
jgi:hypothetical protein